MAQRMYRPKTSKPRKRPIPQTVPEIVKPLLAFANTAGPEGGRRELASPAALSAFLAGQGLLPRGTELMAADLERAREACAGLRALMAATTGPLPRDDALQGLNRVASTVTVRVCFTGDGSPVLERASPDLDGVFGLFFATVLWVRASGCWTRVRLCDEVTCRKAFYDRSGNLCRRWCSPRCGNKFSARDYRRRRKIRRQRSAPFSSGAGSSGS